MENTTVKKPTIVSQFKEIQTILTELNRDDLAEFIGTRIAQVEKKNASGEKSLTPAQKANEELKNSILACMEEGKRYRVSDMLKTFPCCKDLSTSKVSSLLRQMKETTVDKVEEKGVSYFTKR